MYSLRGSEVPEAGRTAKGTAIVNLLNLDAGEKVSAIIPLPGFDETKFLLMATQNGIIKKTPLNEYQTNRKSGLLGITLKDDDNLIDVRLSDGEDDIVLVTKNGLSITFDEKDVRATGRTSQGVIGMRLDEGDEVIGMEPIVTGTPYGRQATLLTITENGFGKRTELEEYRVQNRGGRGVLTYKITPKTGNIVGIRIVTGAEDVMLITDTGTLIRLNSSEISVLGRSTQGVTLMRTNEGKVVSIEAIYPEPEELDEEESSEEKK
jgi:DNA gyrase subunit A